MLSIQTILILLLILYISILPTYKPDKWIKFINISYIKLLILCIILYIIVYKEDIVLAIFMMGALLITIILNNVCELFQQVSPVDKKKEEETPEMKAQRQKEADLADAQKDINKYICKMSNDQNLSIKRYAKQYGDFIRDRIPYNKLSYDDVAETLDDKKTVDNMCNPKPAQKEKFEGNTEDLKPVDYDELVNYSKVDF